MSGIEFAEIRMNDGDGGDYVNIYADGIMHSYLLEDVFERMNEPTNAALRAQLEQAEAERDVYKKIIDDVRAGNYDNAHDITAARKFIFGELEKMPRALSGKAAE